MKRGGLMGILIAGVLALIATFAVLAYVRGVEESSGGTGPRVEVIVAKEDILAGADLDELIEGGAFTTDLVPEQALVQDAVTSLAQLEGRQASAAILAGEQVTLARIQGSGGVLPGGALGIPEGFQAVTLPLEASRVVGGAVLRGDRVTVYATFDKTDTTVTLVPEAQVLKVIEPAGERGIGSAGGETLVTLALTAEDAQKAVFAFEQGSVWLGLLPPGASGIARPPINVAAVLR